MQAANTGLTGGSTPAVGGYDRDAGVINAMRLARIFLVNDTLQQLERVLAPLGREPPSLLGSSWFGASVIGGIYNGSGGSPRRRATCMELVRRFLVQGVAFP